MIIEPNNCTHKSTVGSIIPTGLMFVDVVKKLSYNRLIILLSLIICIRMMVLVIFFLETRKKRRKFAEKLRPFIATKYVGIPYGIIQKLRKHIFDDRSGDF